MLVEVEGIISCRPLTHLYDDDTLEPLTPSHLLYGRNIGMKTGIIVEMMDDDPRNLGKRASHMHLTMQGYWNRFQHAYLSELREHHMYQGKRKTNQNNILKIGDVVVIKDDKIVPRNSWRIGLVESFVIGQDNYVRGAVLIVKSAEGRRTKISRPIQKLIPLEVVRKMNSAIPSSQLL